MKDDSTGNPQERLRILAVARSDQSISFELRVLNFRRPLAERGIELTCRSVPRGRRERRKLAETVSAYDGMWWHRYLISPLHFGAWRRAARRIIFEFDDAVLYSSHARKARPDLVRRIKFSCLVRRCDAVIAGTEYLASHARPYCGDVVILPMAVDVPPAPAPREQAPGTAEMLWLGSRSTMRYLRPLAGVLDRVAALRPAVRLRVIAHEPLACEKLRVDFRPWSPREQERALGECDIGLSPMPDSPWTRGKCPYKVLQYMAHGMAWVGSSVGENLTLSGDGRQGLCAASEDEWVAALVRLVDDVDLRARLGAQGREYAAAHHGREDIADRLALTFRRVVAGGAAGSA